MEEGPVDRAGLSAHRPTDRRGRETKGRRALGGRPLEVLRSWGLEVFGRTWCPRPAPCRRSRVRFPPECDRFPIAIRPPGPSLLQLFDQPLRLDGLGRVRVDLTQVVHDLA